MEGLLIRAVSSFYYVASGDRVYECKARGAFRKSGISPVVGDRVEIELTDNDKGVINAVLPRKNLLRRPIVANLDKLFIVSSYTTPSPDLLMIDRLVLSAAVNDIKPVIVFNKSDMGDMSRFADIYRRSGFSAYVVSATEDIGIKELKTESENCICAFAGNSGVGKSSIINALFASDIAKTGEVSRRLGRGKHTTRQTEIFALGNSFFVDTPGFAAIGFEKVDESFDLLKGFPDFSDHIGGCRYSTCSHTCEPGCSLIEAVNDGRVQKSRYQSYLTFYNELKSIKKW